jgi:hypothetical protein
MRSCEDLSRVLICDIGRGYAALHRHAGEL